MLACSKDLERGVRATLILVERLFRFDVVVGSDSLQTVLRNLSRGELEVRPRHHNEPGTNIVLGEAGVLEPTRAFLGFTLRSAHEAVRGSVTIGALQLPGSGLVRITAQAIVRQERL